MITGAFEQSGAPVRLHVVGDGEQAMQFLSRAVGFANAPGPAGPQPAAHLVLQIACRGHGEG